MGKLIRVKAKPKLRPGLARWARGYKGVRMVSSTELGFPPNVFADIPERFLAGALIDGRPYQMPRHIPASKPAKPAARHKNPRKGAKDATSAGNRPADTARQAVAAPPVAGPPDMDAADTPAPAAAAVAAIPVEETTATVGSTLPEVTATDPAAGPRTRIPGDGRIPAYPGPGIGPVEASATVPGEIVTHAPEPGGQPPSTVELGDSGAEPDAPKTHTPFVVEPRRPRRHAGRRSPGTAGAHSCPEPGCAFTSNSPHGLRVHTGRAHSSSGDAQ